MGIEADSYPTASLDGDFERDLLQGAICGDVLLGNGIGVDDGFDRNRFAVEARGDFGSEANRGRLVELDFAPASANRDDLRRRVDSGGCELHEVAGAVADVRAAVSNPFAPVFINKLAGG